MSTAHEDPERQWRALAGRPGYLSFTATVAASRIVSAMFNTAGVLLVLDRTGSAALTGAVTAAAVLPGALVGPWLGAWLDVLRRRRVLIVADRLASVGALVGLLLLAGHAPNWTLPAVAVLYGVTSPLSYGSFASALSALAGPALLERASAIEATSMNLSIVVGPALAGGLSAAFGPARVVELQAALTVLTAVAIAASPSFEARTQEPTGTVRETMRAGGRAIVSDRLLRDISAASMLTSVTWGLMLISFPLYAERSLHAGRSAGGYLWAAIAVGSILGTFLLPGAASRRRIAGSAVAVALSALLWLLAGSLLAGIVLVTLTGVVEGPYYSGTITLRQRLAPPGARTQVLNTLGSMSMVAMAAGSAIGGLLSDPAATFVVFCGLNLLAAALVGRRALLPDARSPRA